MRIIIIIKIARWLQLGLPPRNKLPSTQLAKTGNNVSGIFWIMTFSLLLILQKPHSAWEFGSLALFYGTSDTMLKVKVVCDIFRLYLHKPQLFSERGFAFFRNVYIEGEEKCAFPQQLTSEIHSRLNVKFILYPEEIRHTLENRVLSFSGAYLFH